MSRINFRTMYYWDTSALIKRYALEAGTRDVDLLIDGPLNAHFMAAIVPIEIHTTLHRMVGESRVTSQQRSQAIKDFVSDALTKPYQAVKVEDADYADALRLANQYALTGAGDALIVAMGIRVFGSKKSDLVWVTCDRLMRHAANAEGFDVYDPDAGKIHWANGNSQRITPA